MNAYPHNVTVSGKTPWPWAPRWVHVEEEKYLKISRPLGFRWGKLMAQDQFHNIIFSLYKRRFSSSYELKESDGSLVSLHHLQPGHWICESPDWTMEVYRLSGSKCVLSKDGTQVAIMSIQPGLAWFNDHQIRIRVNEAPYLHLSIAVALLLDHFSLHINTSLFQKPKVSSLQPG